MKIYKNKHISFVRPETGSAFYWVRFLKRDKNKKERMIAQKTFLVNRYKSKESCLRAAIRWRNKTAKGLDIQTAHSYNLMRKNTKARSTLGIVGVSYFHRIRDERNSESEGVVAAWRQWGKDKKGKRIRVNKTKTFTFPADATERDKKAIINRAKKYRQEMEKIHYKNS